MKQVLQDLSNGNTYVSEAPAPSSGPGQLLIDSRVSLVSAGTERMLVGFGKAGLIEKAWQQPEKVKMVLDKVKLDGLLVTMEAVRSKLEAPISLGYCNVGVVNAVGDGVVNFKVGDRVVSNGCHADVVRVPKNLCAKIPEVVSDEEAVFAIVGSIALQGIRLAQPSLGEAFVVTGVGLIGLLAVQLLKAHGCKVLAIDYDESKLALAEKFGAEVCNPSKNKDVVSKGLVYSDGKGVDGVILTASTKSSDPVTQAAQMSRKRGRIILVGVTGLELNRSDFYEKELTFQVSCSYGPGRYDSLYEDQGHDYPYGFVRWTEQRNFEAVLAMMADGRLDVKPLITHRYMFEDAPKAYELLTNDKSVLGILLQYKSEPAMRHKRSVRLPTPEFKCDPSMPVVGFIGAGNYASRILIPAFKEAGAQLHTVVTSSGMSGVISGRKSGFREAATDTAHILENSEINTVVIATRHNTHASLVVDAINAGKHVFVEKPLAVSMPELDQVKSAYRAALDSGGDQLLMVGFNRRFSPYVQKMEQLLRQVSEPKTFIMTMNAGAIPADHWVQDYKVGGGRIIGEACHYIDLMRYLVGSEIVSVQARSIGDAPGVEVVEDKASVTLGFADGSLGTIHYFANGASTFPKERIEVFCAGRILQLDNFRKLNAYNWPGFKRMHRWRQDKGQGACAQSFLEAITKGMSSPIPSCEIFEVARISIEAASLMREQ